jgi:hypothetical protein
MWRDATIRIVIRRGGSSSAQEILYRYAALKRLDLAAAVYDLFVQLCPLPIRERVELLFRVCRGQEVLERPDFPCTPSDPRVEDDLFAVRMNGEILDGFHRDAHLLGFAA